MYENKIVSGISHFFEHLLFDGTKNFSEQTLLEMRQELGLSLGARTYSDSIMLDASFPLKQVKSSLSLIKEMVFESAITLESVEKERGIILEEIRLRQDDNYIQLWNLASRIRFRNGSPLQLPTEGTQLSAKRISRKQLITFYKRHCNPSNAKLIVIGNYQFEHLKKLITEVFGKLPKNTIIKPPQLNNQHMSQFAIQAIVKAIKQEYFILTFPSYEGYDLTTSWKYSFTLNMLYEELNKALRIENGFVYGLSCSWMRLTHSTSYAYIQTACDPENFEKVCKIVFDKIHEMKTKGADNTTFERIRRTGNKTIPMTFDSLSGVMNWCVDTFNREDRIYSPEEYLKARNKIHLNDLKNTARTLFDMSKLNIATVGPIAKNIVYQITRTYAQDF